MNNPVFEKLIKDYFLINNDIIRISEEEIGWSSGFLWFRYDNNIHRLMHEMAHFVVAKDKQVKDANWGLAYKNKKINSYQDILLEINVFAWQAVLYEKYFNKPFKNTFSAQEFVKLKGFNNYPGSIEQEKINQINDEIFTLSKQRSIAQFNKEWQRKINLLKNNN